MKTQILTTLCLVAGLVLGGTTSLIALDSANSGHQGRGIRDHGRRGGCAEKIKSELGLSDDQIQKLMPLLKSEREHRKAFKKKLLTVLSDEQVEKLRGVMRKLKKERNSQRKQQKSTQKVDGR
ncbi:hypothetical protein P0136_08280 [Lentisphaerota bacterium ZTH]|nr:hypothetical protein JYG24_00610 [Lentisphaerota bacterium]WET05361.1 hypothetical protein P0136_08280 [Lentisphaerota bacterium ZTH]